ncbi:arginine repressor [bacterium]|nr:arginine repressor [bacterium]
MPKKNRQFHILKLIESVNVESQQSLLDELNKKGIEISQSTLSKDLKELGIIKVRGKEGRFRFVQTKEREIYHVGIMLKRELFDFLTDSQHVNNLVILKTISGNASGLAKCLDEIGWAEVMGTVAGDDTVLVITASEKDAKLVLNKLKDILAS